MLEPIPWKRKYPFDTIPVGGQLVIPITHGGQRTTIASAARHFTKRYGWRFRTNLVSTDAHGVIETGRQNKAGNAVRVTRIA